MSQKIRRQSVSGPLTRRDRPCSMDRFGLTIVRRIFPTHLVEREPARLVISQTELAVEKKSRDAALVGRHQEGGVEPDREGEPRVVQNCPGRRARLLAAPSALPEPAGVANYYDRLG